MKKQAITFSILMAVSVSVLSNTCAKGTKQYVDGNYEAALAILDPLAKSGDSCALYQLGEMYNIGDGVKKNKEKAMDLFRESAKKGYAKAKFKLEMFGEE